MTPPRGARDQTIRVARIISRLNVGGPAIQAISLTKLLESRGYRTILVRGREDRYEGSMDDLAERMGVRPVLVPWMRRDVGWRDFLALAAMAWLLRGIHPQLIHSHAAKAGTLARIAAILAFPRRSRRPALVHTFHGHSLSGYFSTRRDRLHLAIERFLARRTDRLIAVSEEVRDDLVSMGLSTADRFEIVRVGFDLRPFTIEGEERAHRRAALRDELGIEGGDRVVTLVARLVPIKRVDRFLRVARLLPEASDIRFVVVGDGELRDHLQAAVDAQALGDRLVWAGFRRDMPDVYFASDVVVQTSDNEGTPVALIEAHAAALPVVTTGVGGTRSVVSGESGSVVDAEDEKGFARAVTDLLGDPNRRVELGNAGRRFVLRRFDRERLLSDVDLLYRSILEPQAE